MSKSEEQQLRQDLLAMHPSWHLVPYVFDSREWSVAAKGGFTFTKGSLADIRAWMHGPSASRVLRIEAREAAARKAWSEQRAKA